MRTGIVIMMILGIMGTALAQDLGPSRELPVKNTPVVIYEPPAVPRQGGDTIADATVIPSLPFTDTGTTAGYIDDYDEVCPYTGSTSPDVVYSYTSEFTGGINVDLCGSGYDTKAYIYDVDLNLIDCNEDAYYYDDPCGTYVSKIENAALLGGVTYYIVIDGYGGDAGPYVLNIEEWEQQCFVYCPENAVLESESPLHDGYEDDYNGGCNSPSFGYPIQDIDWITVPIDVFHGTAWLCARSGWYTGNTGESFRDTDWFLVIVGVNGVMEINVESEFPLYVYKFSSTNCESGENEFAAVADCELPVTLAFPVSAFELVWIWTCPTTFEGPVNEFTYFMTVSNVWTDHVPNEGMSWGGVKALYR